MTSKISRLYRLDPKKTLFLLCDVQEKFKPGIPLFDSMIKNTNKLIQAGNALQIPLVCTEQYPEKMGKTVLEVDIAHACAVIKKTRFSMMVPEMEVKFKEIFGEKPCDVVLFGIETHICIEQTTIDLLDNNINVFMVADCCASRLKQDRDMAIERLRQMGAIVTTSESIIFNLLQDKNHPAFNVVRKLVSDSSLDMELSKTTSK